MERPATGAGNSKPSGAHTKSPTKEAGSPLIHPAERCLEAGRDCFTHCAQQLSTGDASFAECFGTVRAMLATCDSLAQLARLDSPYVKAFAAICAKVCRDCEKACAKHEAHEAVCKACMEACAACASACEKF